MKGITQFITLLVVMVMTAQLVLSAPDPGHDASSVGPGTFAEGNYTFREYLFANTFVGWIDWSNITNKPTIPTVPTSFPYANITDAPSIPTVPTSFPYANITGLSNLDNDSTDDITTAGGTISGNLIINGNLHVIGDVFNATVEQQFLNGSFFPSVTLLFDIGSPSVRWNTIYANTLNGNLDCSNITGASSNLCTLVDTNTIVTTLPYANITGTPTIPTVPTSYPYANITGTPTIPTDTNNYSTSVGVSGTTTKTINIARFGMSNISTTWTDIDTDTDTWNTTAQMQLAVSGNISALKTDNTTQAAAINSRAYPGVCPAGQVVMNTTTSGVQCIAVTSAIDTNETPRINTLVNTDCSAGTLMIGVNDDGSVNCVADAVGEAGTTDGNNYSTSVGVSGTTTKTINIARFGMSNISTTWTDIDTDTDTWNTTAQMFNAVNNSALSLANAYGYIETDSVFVANRTSIWAAIFSVVASNSTMNTRVAALESSNTTQATAIANLVTSNTSAAGRLTALESSNTTQQTLIAALRTDNTTQAGLINARAYPGNCPVGSVVMNTTASGVQCYSIETIYYNANQSVAIEGTVAGTLNLTFHNDGGYDAVTFNITEGAGAPGLDMRVNFTGITSFNKGLIRYKTSALAGEYPIIQLWNYEISAWEDYPRIGESLSFAIIDQMVYDDSEHMSGGIVQMRIYKASNGNTNNKYYIDWIAISEGIASPSGQEVDPYSVHRDGTTPLTGNWNAAYNITVDQLFGKINASYIQNAPWLTAYTDTNDTARVTALESSNTTQATAIANLVTSNTSAAGRLTALESSNTTQQTLIAALRTDNTTQAAAINAKQNVVTSYPYANITGTPTIPTVPTSFPAANITAGTFGAGNYLITGNLNVTTNLTIEKLKFENPTHEIYTNTTCIIIAGPTASIEVC